MKNNVRIPLPRDDEYISLLGEVVYSFAYYEWTIIYIVEYLESGFIAEYCRGRPLESGKVKRRLEDTIKKDLNHPLIVQVQDCCKDFSELIERRNALIHAHPITAEGGEQVLNHQGIISKKYHDVLWTKTEIESFLYDVDQAAVSAAEILDLLRK